jgi:uracil-DNA glycosylase
MARKIRPTPTPESQAGTALAKIARKAMDCRDCDLWANATQTVFGEGHPKARVMFVGEQPGDKEDLAGHPFVGPAGKLFDRALAEAGIDRAQVYVTNAVKHFSHIQRGKMRIHKKPTTTEVAACRRWLEQEIATIRPRMIVCLGATAAQSLLGAKFRVSKQRGEFLESELAPVITATVHPSSILRARDDESRHLQMRQFVYDLKKVAARMNKMS